jgi:DNA mismatch repair protein MutS
MSPIFNEYCFYLSKYKDKYGDKTVLLMQVGSFYEIYARLNDTKQGEIDIYNICQNVMNIAVANKTKDILMGGFQLPYSTKFIKLLIESNYTVVLVNQVTEPPNVERKVTDIISPGTYMETFNKESNNYMMSIYIEKITSEFISVGISIIDVSTGKNYVYQIGKNLDSQFWKDELSRLINYYSPKEYLFQLKNIELSYDDIVNYWDVSNSVIQINHYKDKIYETIKYQNELLQNIFQFKSLLIPIEELNFVYKNELRNSYIYMIQYIYEHKVDSIRNINLPEDIENIHHLLLTSNSVRQLNVISNYSYYKGKYESLYSICNSCGFIGGKRLLKERLLYPSIDPAILQVRYDKIEYFIKDYKYKQVKQDIHKLTDLDKGLRKMSIGVLDTLGFLSNKLSYGFINRILHIIERDDTFNELYSEYTSTILDYKGFYNEILSIFEYSNFMEDRSYFKQGVYTDIDKVDNEISTIEGNIKLISSRLSGIIDADNACKFDNTDKFGYYLYCTKKRSCTLKARLQNLPNQVITVSKGGNIIFEIPSDTISFKIKDTSNVFIECDIINELTSQLKSSIQTIKTLNSKYWRKTLDRLYSKYNKTLQTFHYMVSDIDVSSTIAKLSIENNYCKPELIENNKSCLVATDIRHPIVEKISNSTEYVTNNITLGKDDNDGILLFGTNACGKSTLMKAVGLNVIMAQAGFYVACSSFKLKPYTKIFTRILNNDNIFRSQSSFAVEMMELRSIFHLSDENSLILGDELCSGTETLSAISIISKSLDNLSKKKASYIITSHLHQLNDVPIVKQISNLNVYHLKINYEKGILIYDRKLNKGSGPQIYGLKVCEAMGLPSEFIKGANAILISLTTDTSITTTKVSHYNSDVFINDCKICNKKAEETHHIKEQYLADSNNMIDNHHKNKKHNLVPLCKQCHDKVTYGNLKIYGWKDTSIGIQLDYEYVDITGKNISKYTDDQINIILSYKDKVESKQLTKQMCIRMIDSEYGFTPSQIMINDIFSMR